MTETAIHYDLSVDSLSTIFSHSLKHPTNFVFGAILGKDEASGITQIQHAVPILHSVPLQPLIGIALDQIQTYVLKLSEESDLKLLGIYFSTEFSEDKDIPKCIEHIVDYLSKIRKDPVLVIKLNPPNTQHDSTSLSLYTSGGSTLNLLHDRCYPPKGLEEIILSVSKKDSLRYQGVCDFESHLENINLEWLEIQPRSNLKYVPDLFTQRKIVDLGH